MLEEGGSALGNPAKLVLQVRKPEGRLREKHDGSDVPVIRLYSRLMLVLLAACMVSVEAWLSLPSSMQSIKSPYER